jgi:serine/threonine-protein kinase
VGDLNAGAAITPDLVLLRRLGSGGMATVWLARHQRLQAEVVVKFLSESLVANAEARTRFSREVTATVQVRSPHVVQMLDHGITERGMPFIVMELLEGKDLAQAMKERQLSPDEVKHVVDGVTAALTKAHERGVVHRDIKPANIFLCTGSPRPFVKLLDFGIAKRFEEAPMTATHALLGTPSYMSPEQLGSPGAIDHRADLWSLGVVIYQMLTGKTPFRGAHIANVVHAILNDEIPRLTTARPDLPPALDAWLARALARDLAARFESAEELAAAFSVALADHGEEADEATRKIHPSFVEGTLALGLGAPGATLVSVVPTAVQPAPQGQTVRPNPSAPTLAGTARPVPQRVEHEPHERHVNRRAEARRGGAVGAEARGGGTRWWVMMGATALVVLLIAAVRAGGGPWQKDTPVFPPAASVPPLEGAKQETSREEAATAPIPVVTGTVIGASHENLPPPSTTTSTANPVARQGLPSAPPKKLPSSRPSGKAGTRKNDDVGF